MLRLRRFLLLCLLAVAIPLQGFAAAAMAHAAAEASVDMLAGTGMDMEDGCDHGPAKAAPHKGSCSACAACCAVAAPGFSLQLAFEPTVTAFVMPTLAPPRVAFLTDGPDRPPRTRLA